MKKSDRYLSVHFISFVKLFLLQQACKHKILLQMDGLRLVALYQLTTYYKLVK